jgi:hypothetical protein
MTTWIRTLALGAAAMLLTAWPAAAQAPASPPVSEPAHSQAEALAKQAQNPVSSLITLPMQANFDFGLGDRQATGTTLFIQPVMPFAVSSSTNVVLRVIVPFLSRPGPDEATRYNGVGDVTMTAFFVPSRSGRITWGAGPVMILPAATTSHLGAEKFGIGPSAVVLIQPGHWTIGLLANHIWSTSGANNREDFSITFLQPFASFNLGKGLSVGADLQATGNWNEEEHWNAPLIFKVAKVTSLAGQHVQFEAGAGPVFASSASAASWRFRFNMVFLFPR